jgi:hypothetical protein
VIRAVIAVAARGREGEAVNRARGKLAGVEGGRIVRGGRVGLSAVIRPADRVALIDRYGVWREGEFGYRDLRVARVAGHGRAHRGRVARRGQDHEQSQKY